MRASAAIRTEKLRRLTNDARTLARLLDRYGFGLIIEK